MSSSFEFRDWRLTGSNTVDANKKLKDSNQGKGAKIKEHLENNAVRIMKLNDLTSFCGNKMHGYEYKVLRRD